MGFNRLTLFYIYWVLKGFSFEFCWRYKDILNEAVRLSNWKPRKVIVFQRREVECCPLDHPRDAEWDEELANAEPHPCVPVESNHPLYILYTSGTTGKLILIINYLVLCNNIQQWMTNCLPLNTIDLIYLNPPDPSDAISCTIDQASRRESSALQEATLPPWPGRWRPSTVSRGTTCGGQPPTWAGLSVTATYATLLSQPGSRQSCTKASQTELPILASTLGRVFSFLLKTKYVIILKIINILNCNLSRIIQEHKVNAIITAPTALRVIKKVDQQLQFGSNYSTKSLVNFFITLITI